MNFIKNGRVYDVMPCADSFNDIHEIKCGQAEEKLEAGGDEKLIFNFIWPYWKMNIKFYVLTGGSLFSEQVTYSLESICPLVLA